MTSFLLLDDTDVQRAFAAHFRKLREEAKLSRESLHNAALFLHRLLKGLS